MCKETMDISGSYNDFNLDFASLMCRPTQHHENDSPSSAPMYIPPKLPVAASLLQKLFGGKVASKQGMLHTEK